MTLPAATTRSTRSGLAPKKPHRTPPPPMRWAGLPSVPPREQSSAPQAAMPARAPQSVPERGCSSVARREPIRPDTLPTACNGATTQRICSACTRRATRCRGVPGTRRGTDRRQGTHRPRTDLLRPGRHQTTCRRGRHRPASRSHSTVTCGRRVALQCGGFFYCYLTLLLNTNALRCRLCPMRSFRHDVQHLRIWTGLLPRSLIRRDARSWRGSHVARRRSAISPSRSISRCRRFRVIFECWSAPT